MSDRLHAAALIAGLIATVTFGILGGVHACRERARCTDNGGHFERRNCHEVESWNCMTNMDGNTDCHFETDEQCDHVCVGAMAEAHP